MRFQTLLQYRSVNIPDQVGNHKTLHLMHDLYVIPTLIKVKTRTEISLTFPQFNSYIGKNKFLLSSRRQNSFSADLSFNFR